MTTKDEGPPDVPKASDIAPGGGGSLEAGRRAALWEALVEHSPDVISVHAPDGTLLFASPSAERFFGQAPATGEVGVAPIYQRVHPDDVREMRAAFSDLTATPGKTMGPITFRLRTGEGGWRHLEAYACNLLENEQVGGILVTTRDITERAIAQRALAQSEHRYRRLVERSPEPIAVYRGEHLVYANPAALRLLGATSVEQLRKYPIIELVLPADRETAEAALAPVARGEEMAPTEIRLISLEGRTISTEILGIPIIYDGEPSVQVLVRDVTDHKRAMEALEYQALHDPLTGLPNRALFMDRVTQALGRAQRAGGRLVVMLADLDRFKIVNDSLSHAVGDKILIGVAERMRTCFRPSDTVARFGGDEFVVLCEDTEDLTTLGTLGERLIHVLEDPIVVAGESFHLSISVGITESDGGKERADDLLRDADSAMNRAKESGRGRYEIFNEETGRHVAGRLQTETALRHAITHSELRAFYQPVVDARTGAVTGFEALIRWMHPENGLTPPIQFIPVAEDSGLIVPIGAWILAEACRQCKEWEELVGPGRTLEVSVNLSPRQFLDPGLLPSVREILEAVELDTSRIKLYFEVTEGMLMSERRDVRDVLEAFRALGVGIVIDDFGTGYSSFSYLKRFPVESLKIDRSFVMGLGGGSGSDDEAIVRAMIQLSEALGLRVIAEGVETTDQLLRLRELGCDLIQGFYFSKPQPADDVTEMISRPFAVPEPG